MQQTGKATKAQYGKATKAWYHQLSHSQRTGSFDVFIECISKVANYVHWIVEYLENLMNGNTTYCEWYKEFTGELTGKSFQR